MAEQFNPVIYFGPDCTDRAVIKRIEQFEAQGYQVIGVTFRRIGYSLSSPPHWMNIHLGTLEHKRYLRRSFILFRSFWRLFRQRGKFRNATFFYARNLDNALLALFARWVSGTNKPFVYEVLDIRPICLAPGLAGGLFRRIERLVLQKCKLLVVSSPSYVQEYFGARLNYHGPWFLLENKMPKSLATCPAIKTFSISRSPISSDGRWVIGWFGLFKCQESWDLLKNLAVALPDRIKILLRGIPRNIDREDIFLQLKILPNITFGGEYRNPDDLPAMYASVDLVWNINISGGNKNSRWCLSNRSYEAGCYLKPVLSRRDDTGGNFVIRHNLGWVFDEPIAENLRDFFINLSVDEYIAKRQAVEAAPRSLFVETDDIERLCRTIIE